MAEKGKKKNVISNAINFVKEAREEMKKVTWPTREEVTNFTIVTVITVFILAIFLWGVDTGLMALIRHVLK